MRQEGLWRVLPNYNLAEMIVEVLLALYNASNTTALQGG